jgi:hypothetical protein
MTPNFKGIGDQRRQNILLVKAIHLEVEEMIHLEVEEMIHLEVEEMIHLEVEEMLLEIVLTQEDGLLGFAKKEKNLVSFGSYHF